MIDDNTIKSLLENPQKGSRNHLITDCPFCLKERHFYVKLKTKEVDRYGKNKSYSWDCKKCGESGRVGRLLQKLDKLYLLEHNEIVDIKNVLPSLEQENYINLMDLDTDLKTIKMPKLSTRIFKNNYLDNKREFDEEDYKHYPVYKSDFLFKYQKYVFFEVIQEYKTIGFVGRLIDEDSDKNRYNNSETDFTKALYGYDEIDFLTRHVILVEGIFDKIAVDKKLNLRQNSELKCCATFGSKISPEQIKLLVKKDIDGVILMHEKDLIEKLKQNSIKIHNYINTEVANLPEDKDPDDCSVKEICDSIIHREPIQNFFTKKVAYLK